MIPDQSSSLHALTEFLKLEEKLEEMGKEDSTNYDKLRFVGYALDIGYDKTTIITSDPYKINVGGIPRNSFLIMLPTNYDKQPPHMIILQVLDSTETPLRQEVQQTYFELHKKSMPELDRFTQSELQWGALKTSVLGMFYENIEDNKKIEFSHDQVNYTSAHKYKIYSPPKEILEMIINSLISDIDQFPIGKVRLTENRLPINNQNFPQIDVKVSTKDFLGARTALFGKTRLGKSNTVKIIAQSIIETTTQQNVGQLIFDVDGEYANDNLQDDNKSIYSEYKEFCEVYSFHPKNKDQKAFKLNFYEHPDEAIQILKDLLAGDNKTSNYITAFGNTELVSLQDIKSLEPNKQMRLMRQILMYWAILWNGSFSIDFSYLETLISGNFKKYRYGKELLDAAYSDAGQEKPVDITNMSQLVKEFEIIQKYRRSERCEQELLKSTSGSGHSLFEAEDDALLNFLLPKTGSGPSILSSYKEYHSKNGRDAINEIVDYLDNKKTVIADLSNAHPSVLLYFTKKLTSAVFHHQERKFVKNMLNNDNFIQIYFEEAHNLFPKDDDSGIPDIYKRVAKEGAKFHIGMVYSTQSVTTINSDLLAQTENFFIAHMSSQDELKALIKTNIFFENYKFDILRAKTVGYMKIITRSHRFVIPTQIKKFELNSKILNKRSGEK